MRGGHAHDAYGKAAFGGLVKSAVDVSIGSLPHFKAGELRVVGDSVRAPYCDAGDARLRGKDDEHSAGGGDDDWLSASSGAVGRCAAVSSETGPRAAGDW